MSQVLGVTRCFVTGWGTQVKQKKNWTGEVYMFCCESVCPFGTRREC